MGWEKKKMSYNKRTSKEKRRIKKKGYDKYSFCVVKEYENIGRFVKKNN